MQDDNITGMDLHQEMSVEKWNFHRIYNMVWRIHDA